MAYHNIGNLHDSLTDFNKAIYLKPQFANAHLNRGIAHYENGNFDSALIDSSEAIRLKHQDANAYYIRGTVHFALEKYKQSDDDFRQADALQPDEPIILAGLAITQFMLENSGDAKRIWRGLVAQDARYMDADWVGKELRWRPELVEAARKLIATL